MRKNHWMFVRLGVAVLLAWTLPACSDEGGDDGAPSAEPEGNPDGDINPGLDAGDGDGDVLEPTPDASPEPDDAPDASPESDASEPEPEGEPDAPDASLDPDVSEPEPEAEPDGACENDADEAALRTHQATLTDKITGCVFACLGQMPECVTACMVRDVGLSQPCAGCFAQTVACTLTQCAAVCLNPMSPACADCQAMHCNAAFEACSGIAPAR